MASKGPSQPAAAAKQGIRLAAYRTPTTALLALLTLIVAACGQAPTPAAMDSSAARPSAAPTAPTAIAPALVIAAREQIGVTRHYDPAYVRLSYPGGDVPIDRGVCTDVLIRAFRQQGLDLQQRVHEDMRQHFAAYPQKWGLRAPDRNIDHRRVPILQRWFERQDWSRPVAEDATHYLAGDVVTWDLGGGVPHIGIVSNRSTRAGVPLIIHNIGAGTREDDILFQYRVTGQYRPRAFTQRSAPTRQ